MFADAGVLWHWAASLWMEEALYEEILTGCAK